MFKPKRPVLAAIMLGCLCSLLTEARERATAKAVMFYPISELKVPAGVGPTVVGGVPADPKDWPASFYSMHGNSACTSNLVGPRALLTAAHCVAGGRGAVLTFERQRYTSVCSVSKHYKERDRIGKTADWALCLLDRPVEGIDYETVNDDATRVRIGSEVLLTGFGCTETNMTGGNDGVFRTAPAPVKQLPAGSNNDITTEVPTGKATLCPGDSGGGAFLTGNNVGTRRQISVNSRTEIDRTATGAETVVGISYLSSLSTPAAKEFLTGWMATTGQAICGLTPGASGCRRGP